MKQFATLIFIVMIATFVGVVAYRISSDALALIVGVLLGIAALIPTFIIVAILLKKQQQPDDHRPMYQPQPPVVVVGGGGFPTPLLQAQSSMSAPNQPLIPPPPAQPRRHFRMMGYETTEAINLHDDEWATM